jgi:prepilin signal peptidase PulO-like enzyme (type II secretory pathway)
MRLPLDIDALAPLGGAAEPLLDAVAAKTPAVLAVVASYLLVRWATAVWVPRVVNAYGIRYFDWQQAWIPGTVSRWIAVALQGAFVAAWARAGGVACLPFAALMAVALNGVVQADARFHLIPDRFQIVGALGAIGALIVLLTRPDAEPAQLLMRAGGGLLVAVGLYAMSWAFERWRQRPALGFGDVKLVAWLGLVMGTDVLLVLLVAMLAAQAVILPMVLLRRRTMTSGFAFGPYLVLGVLAQVALSAYG